MPGIGDQLGSGHRRRGCLAAAQRDQWILLAVDDEERHVDTAQPLGPVGGGREWRASCRAVPSGQ